MRAAVQAGLLAAALAFAAGCVEDVDPSPPPARAGPSAITVWAVGDAAEESLTGMPLAKLIAASRPDLFLYLGDVYETGSPEEFRRHYEPLYGSLASRTLPTLGNHEWSNREKGYFPYWKRKRGGRPLPEYYAALRGGWQLISLDTIEGFSRESAQGRWLRRRLKRRGSCRLAFFHIPRHSAGDVHGDSPQLEGLYRMFSGRVRVALAGHEHDSQRIKGTRGVLELIAGAGGRALYGLERDPRLIWGDDEDHAALRMRLKPGLMRYAFIADDGRVLYRGSTRCRPLRT
jgi:3',5'-cyclic AMP phosphodiesterase CpdA